MATPATATAATAEEGRAIAETAGREAEQSMRSAVSELDRTADRAREAVDRAIGQPVPAPARPATSTTQAAAKPAPATATTTGGAAEAADQLGRSTTLSQAAEALADDLMRIPGIQRFGGMRLEELETSGPRPLRTMWRIAREQLQGEYGQLTIGEIIDRYRGGGGVSTGT